MLMLILKPDTEIQQEKQRQQQTLRQEHLSYMALDRERQQMAKQMDMMREEHARQLRLAQEEGNAKVYLCVIVRSATCTKRWDALFLVCSSGFVCMCVFAAGSIEGGSCAGHGGSVISAK